MVVTQCLKEIKIAVQFGYWCGIRANLDRRNSLADYTGKVKPFALAIALSTLQIAHAALSIMPLKDVRAGMRGIGKTVFNGDKIEDFQVEILGVLDNTGPKESLILARLWGG